MESIILNWGTIYYRKVIFETFLWTVLFTNNQIFELTLLSYLCWPLHLSSICFINLLKLFVGYYKLVYKYRDATVNIKWNVSYHNQNHSIKSDLASLPYILFGIFKLLFFQITYLQLSRGMCEKIRFYTQPPKAFLIQIKTQMP